jgi:hypothetical protein
LKKYNILEDLIIFLHKFLLFETSFFLKNLNTSENNTINVEAAKVVSKVDLTKMEKFVKEQN